MLNDFSKHFEDYWIDGNLKDCCNIYINNNNSKKLNNLFLETRINDTNERKHKNRNSSDDKSSNSTKSTDKQYNNKNTSNRNEISLCRVATKETPDKYRNLHKESDANKYKREMHKLSEGCNVYEYRTRENKILLDTFTKPKLIYTKK